MTQMMYAYISVGDIKGLRMFVLGVEENQVVV